jgi:hypothetical protein
VLRAKIANLHGLVTERFGPATSHRAGRWALDRRQVGILQALRLVADSSAAPGLNPTPGEAPDYARAPLAPYWLGFDDVCVPGDSAVLEVPCTVKPAAFAGQWTKSRISAALLRRLGLNAQWLRALPHGKPDAMLAICEWAKSRLPCLNLMAHSSEFLAGASPYWPTEDAVDRQFSVYRAVFGWWNTHSVQACTLSGFARAFQTQQ